MDAVDLESFDPESFDPESFDPESFDPESFDDAMEVLAPEIDAILVAALQDFIDEMQDELPDEPRDEVDRRIARDVDAVLLELNRSAGFPTVRPGLATILGVAIENRDWTHVHVVQTCVANFVDNFEPPAYLEELRWRCLLYTSPSPRDGLLSRMPSSA